jgi:nucleotide-binding universal stress UspA family protein
MARIVVGYDGSTGAEQALQWAVAEAALRHAELELVGCWQFPVLIGPVSMGPIAVQVTDGLVTATDHLVTAAADRVAQGHDGLKVHAIVIEGHPADALIDAAQDADLLVLGSRGHGGFTSLLIGSVGLHCVAHSPCPVVIVRPRPFRGTGAEPAS